MYSSTQYHLFALSYVKCGFSHIDTDPIIWYSNYDASCF